MAAGVSLLSSSDTPVRPDLRREIALGLAVFALYGLVTAGGATGHDAAAVNGNRILEFERALHIDVEQALNHWLAGTGVFRFIVNYEYAITYLAGAVVTMVWLYVRRPEAYRQARTSFVLINLAGITCFAAFPVMPPRLMPGDGFIDTVRLGGTWLSWGSPLVQHANQLAAMPSLHVAWAVWMSVSLVRASAPRPIRWLSALHVPVTVFVIMATANHYLLDAVVGALLTAACVGLVRLPRATTADPVVPAADAFFLAVETPEAPQHVGGLVLLDTEREEVTRDKLVALVLSRLDRLPRFRQRLSEGGRWRRHRWVDSGPIDWDWHIQVRDVSGPDGTPGGEAGVHAEVARVQSETLPRDRPMWRLILLTGVAPGRAALIFIMHHVVADGIGTITHAMHLLEPALPEPEGIVDRRPKGLKAVAGTVAGLVALAGDGLAKPRLPAGGGERSFATVRFPFDEVRELAKRHGARVSDVLLAAVAGGLRRALLDGRWPLRQVPERLRISVPLMVRKPGDSPTGNLTAAVMMDLPLGPGTEPERLARTIENAARLRSGIRILASRFVMGAVGQALPPPVHAWFARAVYGGRFFQAIVSNVPGAAQDLTLAGAPLVAAHPILPVAPGTSLVVGALGWNGELCLGVTTDPSVLPAADSLAAAVRAAYDDMLTAG